MRTKINWKISDFAHTLRGSDFSDMVKEQVGQLWDQIDSKVGGIRLITDASTVSILQCVADGVFYPGQVDSPYLEEQTDEIRYVGEIGRNWNTRRVQVFCLVEKSQKST